jgi:hypothetical protein
MSELDRLTIWQDPAIRNALSWYLDVAENRRPAKFRIAATIATQLEPAAASEDALSASARISITPARSCSIAARLARAQSSSPPATCAAPSAKTATSRPTRTTVTRSIRARSRRWPGRCAARAVTTSTWLVDRPGVREFRWSQRQHRPRIPPASLLGFTFELPTGSRVRNAFCARPEHSRSSCRHTPRSALRRKASQETRWRAEIFGHQ